MKRHFGIYALIVLIPIAGFSSFAYGEDPPTGQPEMSPEQKEMMEKWAEYATPGPFHQYLAQRVGHWDYQITMWCDPNAPPTQTTGSSETKLIMGGRYLVDKTTGTFHDQPFEGMGIIGYDNAKKKYVSTWIDNMGTGIMVAEGQCDAQGKVFTYLGQYVDPMTNTTKQCKSVETILDPNTWKMEMSDLTSDGKENKMFEIIYTRKQ